MRLCVQELFQFQLQYIESLPVFEQVVYYCSRFTFAGRLSTCSNWFLSQYPDIGIKSLISFCPLCVRIKPQLGESFYCHSTIYQLVVEIRFFFFFFFQYLFSIRPIHRVFANFWAIFLLFLCGQVFFFFWFLVGIPFENNQVEIYVRECVF